MISEEIIQIMSEMEERLEICPRCKTRQPLAQVWIQKKSWGGAFREENLAELCLPCDEDWRRYIKEEGLDSSSSFGEFRRAFESFLQTPVGPKSTAARALAILKELAGLRVTIATEEQRWGGRYRARSGRLDEVYPLAESKTFSRLAREIFGSGAKNVSWQKLLMSQVATVTRFKRKIEGEIANQLRYFPIWDMYLEHIPGVSSWLAGFLIQAIEDPRRFKGPSALTAFAGGGVIWDEEKGIPIAKPRMRDAPLGYDPLFKNVMVELLPQALLYQKTRFSDSPYSQLFDSIREKEDRKAEGANPLKCRVRGCRERDIVNLGYRGRTFLGFCCRKTLKAKRPHKFLHPGHRHRRVKREVGKKFLTDFYLAWLYLLGKAPRARENPRVVWVFNRALEAHTSED